MSPPAHGGGKSATTPEPVIVVIGETYEVRYHSEVSLTMICVTYPVAPKWDS